MPGDPKKRTLFALCTCLLVFAQLIIPAQAQCQNGQCVADGAVFQQYLQPASSPAIHRATYPAAVHAVHSRPVILSDCSSGTCVAPQPCASPVITSHCQPLPCTPQYCHPMTCQPAACQPYCHPAACQPYCHARPVCLPPGRSGITGHRWRGLSIGIGWTDRVNCSGYCYRN